jgi:hypothetical protein
LIIDLYYTEIRLILPYLAPNIYCCGAGTAAGTEKTTELIRWVERTDDILILY